MSALFIANEYYLSKLKIPFIKNEKLAVLLVWSSVFLFFQNYVGAISIFLLALYALLLEHIKLTDIRNHVKKYWYLIILFALTQISFIYRAIFLNWLTGSFAQISVKTVKNQIDWPLRIYSPIVFTFESHPLAVFLFVAAIIGLLFVILRDKSFLSEKRRTKYLAIALIHPILVYLIFHIGVGFNYAVRYAIFMTIALAFSSTILLSELRPILVKIALGLSASLFFVIGIHSFSLYWHQSLEMDLLKTIETKYNSPNNVFVEKPDALHLTLPINTGSLSLLNKKRQDMGRFKFLLQNKNLLKNNTSFKPISIITYTETEFNEALAHFQNGTTTIWTITTKCADQCTDHEIESDTCFEVRRDACVYGGAREIGTLSTFLTSKYLGDFYAVHKVSQINN